jgi:hypothetical protein
MLRSLIQGLESSGRFTNRMPGRLTTVEVKNSVWFHDCVSAAHFFLQRLVFCSPTLHRLSSSRALNRKGTRVQSRENGEQRGCKFTVPNGTPMAESSDSESRLYCQDSSWGVHWDCGELGRRRLLFACREWVRASTTVLS